MIEPQYQRRVPRRHLDRKGRPMKIVTSAAIALSVAVLGFSSGAQAQSKKLFFEGDIVRHALEGQQGPFCVLNNQYKRKEAVAWRIRVLDGTTGAQADDKALKSVVVLLGNGQKLPAKFGGHGASPRPSSSSRRASSSRGSSE